MLHPIPSHPVTPHPILFYILICLISWLKYTTCNNPIVLRSSSSLSQPVHSFRAEKCTDAPANSIFSGPITPLLSVLCILIEKILSCERIFFLIKRTSARKRKTKQNKQKRKDFSFSSFALWTVVFKGHHGSEGLKGWKAPGAADDDDELMLNVLRCQLTY